MKCIVVVSVFFVYGCVERYSTVDGTPSDTAATTIRVDNGTAESMRGTILVDTPTVRRPLRITVQGDYLIVADRDATAPVKLINRFTGRVDAVFGAEIPPDGGPISASALAPTDATSCCEVWILDAPRQRLYLAKGDAGLASVTVSGSVLLDFYGSALMFLPIGGNQFVISGVFDTLSRFAVTDSAGRPTGWFGELPNEVPEIPYYVQQHAYQSSMARRPGDHRFVVAARHASVLAVVDASERSVAEIETLSSFFPSYGVSRPGATSVFSVNADTQFGYVDIAASRDRIWALYSGSRFGDDPSGAALATELHVFDWTRSFLGRRMLDHAALTIAAAPSGDSLYVTRRKASHAILVYTGGTLATLLQ